MPLYCCLWKSLSIWHSWEADRLSNSFTNRLGSEFEVKQQVNIRPHLKCVSTVTCEMWSKIAMLNWVNWNATQASAIRYNCWKNIHVVMLALFGSLVKDIHHSGDSKRPTWPTMPCSNQEERHRDKTPAHTINILSLVSWQVVDKTRVWYTLILESWSVRPVIATWCCYHSCCCDA